MPITKSAKKSLKVSKTKAKQNRVNEAGLEKAIRLASKENLPAGRHGVSKVISLIDKASKTGIIHKNKAARLKSRLTKKFGTPKATKSPKVKTSKTKLQNDKAKSKVIKKKTVKSK